MLGGERIAWRGGARDNALARRADATRRGALARASQPLARIACDQRGIDSRLGLARRRARRPHSGRRRSAADGRPPASLRSTLAGLAREFAFVGALIAFLAARLNISSSQSSVRSSAGSSRSSSTAAQRIDHRGGIASEGPGHLGWVHLEDDVTEVHRDLAGERGLGRPARPRTKVLQRHTGGMGDRRLHQPGLLAHQRACFAPPGLDRVQFHHGNPLAQPAGKPPGQWRLLSQICT